MAFLAVPEPFDLALTTARFRAFGTDRASLWLDDALHRVVGGRELVIAAAPGGVEVEPLDAETEPVVRRLLGLDFDLGAFYGFAAADARLARLVARFPGFRPALAPDAFEALVTSITAQQVSLFSAVAIRNRLVERFGEQVGLAWAFPTRRRLASATEDELVALGFSRRKAEYVVGLARSDLDLDALAALPDEEVKARLVAERGLGEWTADWYLARHLGRPRAWPAGDLALRKAIAALYGDVDVRAAGARFDPFQNLTAHYLLATFTRPVIRPATADDLPLVRELWQAFEEEIPDEPWREVDAEEDLAALEGKVREELVLLAEEDGSAVGLAVATRRGPKLGFLDVVYVRPDARRGGVAAELVREVVARLKTDGAEMLELEVLASNGAARAVYERWGLRPVELTLGSRLAELERRLAPAAGPTFGSIHVQTDDCGAVERAVQKVLPRMGHSAGTSVTGPRSGWVAVHDDLCDREPARLKALAKELSYALPAVTLSIGVEEGAVVRYNLFDRGGDVDEYLSVPEHYGELPPGDVVALGSNPTVVARLTGADARCVRETARTAASPAELPPALDLVRQIADVMGIAEADHGWEGS